MILTAMALGGALGGAREGLKKILDEDHEADYLGGILTGSGLDKASGALGSLISSDEKEPAEEGVADEADKESILSKDGALFEGASDATGDADVPGAVMPSFSFSKGSSTQSSGSASGSKGALSMDTGNGQLGNPDEDERLKKYKFKF